MTNGEKYLKDGASIYDFLVNYAKWYVDKHHRLVVTTPLEDFLRDECKPTLSEDERVILRNIDKNIYTIIGFDVHGLYLRSDDDNSSKEYSFYDMFNSLFQFICDGEEYKISDLLEE